MEKVTAAEMELGKFRLRVQSFYSEQKQKNKILLMKENSVFKMCRLERRQEKQFYFISNPDVLQTQWILGSAHRDLSLLRSADALLQKFLHAQELVLAC